MDVRKETLTGMLRTTGSKRVSVIIQDKIFRKLCTKEFCGMHSERSEESYRLREGKETSG